MSISRARHAQAAGGWLVTKAEEAMATGKYYLCKNCQRRTFPPRLFDALLDFSRSTPKCGACGAERELHVVLPFGLGAGSPDCRVLSAFLPREPVSWEHQRKKVTFYPFLVVVQRAGDKGQSFWLPYWHVHGERRKYGQYAPFMDDPQFANLVKQAQQKGYL
jgi:hypothetical protein